MEKLGLNQLREMFQDFYASKDHYKGKSFSLIPEKDKSLLIINSGMAPLKPYFSGAEVPPSKRMTTCQKCIRTGDIENVGYTSRHGTFFEMLGSFSFGDYFKIESLTWGWAFITQVLKMPVDNLWATVYEEDEEAYGIWKDIIGMPLERIVKLGKKDNFWEIGTGPCGPCSEIYFDRGAAYGCDNPDCKPGCDCDRYVEFWNHVFTQFSKDDAGNYTNLASPNIDTGMGLERLACIMQGVDSIFDVDTIKSLLDVIALKAGIQYENGTTKTDISLRIMTDHIRSITFMVGDGIIPSNEGRGYVLRRLLRRAARHGKLLGLKGTFLPAFSEKVIEISGNAYPELEEKKEYIHKIITIEEEKFASTIDQGSAIIAEFVRELSASGSSVLCGEKVFKLYDTFGFPLELTQEILEENGCTADIDGFNVHMQRQKETARAARKNENEEGWMENSDAYMFEKATEFTGYQKLTDSAVVKNIFKDKEQIEKVSEGDLASIVLDQTPFYAESGGQASDTGMIYNGDCSMEVLEVSKFKNVFMHKVKVCKGQFCVNDAVTCLVSESNRNHTARNHTATHLLHQALKEVIGDHVAQAGSSVTSEGLRFDFNAFEAASQEQLRRIEDIVNDKISLFLPVTAEEMPASEAIKSGATALFGEKYGDTVRVVKISDFSKELCGGIHVSNTGQIGTFKITSESGIASGIRRIEAITGAGILKSAIASEELIHAASEILKTTPSTLLQKLELLTEEVKVTKKELEEFKRKAVSGAMDKMLEDAEEIGDLKLITKAFKDYNINDLRNLSDDIKADNKGIVIVLASENDGKVTFMVSVSDDLLEKGIHAGNMIKKIAAAAGGGGGGKADMAQAGAKDPSKIKDAFEVAKSLLTAQNS